MGIREIEKVLSESNLSVPAAKLLEEKGILRLHENLLMARIQ
jgi:hypothetical protein